MGLFCRRDRDKFYIADVVLPVAPTDGVADFMRQDVEWNWFFESSLRSSLKVTEKTIPDFYFTVS